MTWLDDIEQRLMRAGARGIGQQLADQVGRAFGGHQDRPPRGREDVWDVATHEDLSAGQQPPECAWCPLCRAIRLSHQSGPGLAGHVSGAADTLATAAQDALQVLDDILSRSSPPRRDGAARDGAARDGAARDGAGDDQFPRDEQAQPDDPAQPDDRYPRDDRAPGNGQVPDDGPWQAGGRPPDEPERPGDRPGGR